MSYELCTNCATEVTDPTNPSEETRYVHLETFAELCHVEDLRAAGLSESEIQEQADGVANYSACPTPPNDDEPAEIERLPEGVKIDLDGDPYRDGDIGPWKVSRCCYAYAKGTQFGTVCRACRQPTDHFDAPARLEGSRQ